VSVRPFRPADAGGVVDVLAAVVPYLVTTAEAFAWQMAFGDEAPEKQRVWVATDGARVVGFVRAGLAVTTENRAFVIPFVLPAARCRGLGTALVAAGEAYVRSLGATSVRSWVVDDAASAAFATRRGFAPGMAATFQSLDLGAFDVPRPRPASGVEVLPGTALDDPHPLYLLDAEATRDIPSYDGDGIDFATWRMRSWDRPDIDHALTTVVTVDGAVAGYTLVQTDRHDRYWSAMTGILRAHRGRGFAMLAKADSLGRARDAGYRIAYTANDETNAPMLAVNRALGYRPAATQWRYDRALQLR
jgi:GNAT superfamily N-acetyltransferase